MGQVLIQKNAGEFHSINTCNAYLGFAARGFEIIFAEFAEMMNDGVAHSPECIVVGAVAFVRKALSRLGVHPPTIDYPDCLNAYLGRRVDRSTLGEVRGAWQPESQPVFVKPLEVHKAFVGHVISQFRDLIRTARWPDDLPVWVSEPIVFTSEWRFCVLRGEVVGAGNYKGDPLAFPDRNVVQAAVRDFEANAPVAYGFDFGLTAQGETRLVEVNDAFSLGCYGVDRLNYSAMLEARWRELTRTVTST